MATPVTTYREAARRFMSQAYAELEAGDLSQASEKGWGAAAQMVEAVAQQRGWRHDQHGYLFEVVNNLSEQKGDPEIHGLFANPNLLHVNFYEGKLGASAVEYHLSLTERFMGKIESILDE